MSRFHADTEAERRELFAEAIAAHRARESPFCTFEADGGEPWIQVGRGGSTDGSGTDTGALLVNIDCTDAELSRLETLLNEFPGFSIEGMTSPQNAEGTNVRIGAFADVERLAGFLDRCFQSVYDLPEGYSVWAAEI